MVSYKCALVTLSVKSTVFEIFDFRNSVTLKTGLGVRQGRWKYYYSIDRLRLPINLPQQPWDYLVPFPFQSKIAKFSHPLVFCTPGEGVPLRIRYRRWVSKSRIMGLPCRQRSLTISSAMWIEYTNVTAGQTNRQTDRQTYRHRATAKTALTHSVAK